MEANITFSHLNEKQLPHMVDISHKKMCSRKAIAHTIMELDKKILSCIQDSDIHSPKGAVFATAVIAGIQAVKNTPVIIPLCHNIPLSHCNIDIEIQKSGICIVCSVKSNYATGVEIEAIMGCSVAAITVYDMCKSINNNMCILETKLLSKEKKT